MKQFIAIMLSVCMLVCISLPVVAMQTEQDLFYEYNESDYLEENYIRYELQMLPTENAYSRSGGLNSNTARIEDAIEQVKALGLTQQGYGYIQESCIKQLESFAAEEANLLSYSVLVPRASDPFIMADFGRYNGRDYCWAYYSSYAREICRESSYKENDADEWAAWANGIINLAMNFMSLYATLPYSVLADAADAAGYTIRDTAYIENYIVVEGTCRGIYTYDDEHNYNNDGSAVMLWADEWGYARATSVLHPVSVDYGAVIPLTPNSPIEEVCTTYYNSTSFILETCDYLYNQHRESLLPRTWRLTSNVGRIFGD